mgnify:CR=1 FL=1
MLLRPTYYLDDDLTSLDVDMLLKDGIKGLILDLDSTLMAPKTGSLTEEASAWLEQARSSLKIVILSEQLRLSLEFNLTLPTSDKSYLSELKNKLLNI